MSERPVSVAVVNDYELVVQGLAAMLEPYADRVVLVDMAAREKPSGRADVVLYDTFGAEHGADVDYARVLDECGAGRLALYCWLMRADVVEAALRHGASGYLSKRLGAGEVVDAVERIHAGEVVVAGEMLEDDEIVEWPVGDWPGRAEGLTEREAEVLAWITRGVSNETVADRVFLSINTVKSHVRTAYRKMGVANRSEAVLWAVDHGFRDTPWPQREGERDDRDAL